MTRRRFYAPPAAFAPDGAGVVLSEEESRHLRDVLRLRAGDEAFVFDGEGREFACVVAAPGGRREPARLEVRWPAPPPHPESPLSLTLAVALLKGEKFDLVVQKATELGVARVAPVVTRRADVRPRASAAAATPGSAAPPARALRAAPAPCARPPPPRRTRTRAPRRRRRKPRRPRAAAARRAGGATPPPTV